MAKLCRAYTGQPLNYVPRKAQARANRHKKGKKQKRPRQQREIDKQMNDPNNSSCRKKRMCSWFCLLGLHIIATQAYQSLSPVFSNVHSLSKQNHRVFSLLSLSHSHFLDVLALCFFMLYADSSFCYFQTRISFRNTICTLQYQNGLIKHTWYYIHIYRKKNQIKYFDWFIDSYTLLGSDKFKKISARKWKPLFTLFLSWDSHLIFLSLSSASSSIETSTDILVATTQGSLYILALVQ